MSLRPAKLARSTLSDAGLSFSKSRRRSYYDDDSDDDRRWSRSGRGKLDADGQLALNPSVQLDNEGGPQEFTIEADVTDASYRHIAGRGSAVLHPADRYAGLRLKTAWTDVEKPLSVDLGVAGTDGQPISGVKVSAKLVHVDWKYTRKRTSSGVEYDWHKVRKEVDSCSVTSATTPVSCDMTPPESGRYEIISSVGGRRGGTATTWAWRRGGSSSRFPTKGHRIDLVSDKPRYAPGDRAKILVRNPYPAATAILTLEQGGLVTHRSLAIEGGAEVVEVPITRSHAPRIHATVTLIPRNVSGADRADWKVGVLRLPISLEDAELDVAIKTDRAQYKPGETVTLDVDVKNGTKGVAGAEVAVAVVDEGILRMTNHHAPDPVKDLRPGQALNFEILDSREGLAALMRLSKPGGDGDSGPENQDSTRKKFVQTALWKPALRTDANGRAQVVFTLPDNLTKFRVMAVVLDKDGRGGSEEYGFTVRKPVMMIPIIPRFAHVGDQFEAATMLHNNTDAPLDAKVTLGRREQAIEIKPHKRARVNFPLTAEKPGDLALAFSVSEGSQTHDSVEVKLPIDRAGVGEHPRLDGAFVQGQDIRMQVPDGVYAGRGQNEVVKVLVGQHLWPELGARLEFLLGYPHGCVEQTTSSTLPLLAARDILPRIGLTSMPKKELDKRIKSGIDRLASMRTSGGGLAYWPGGSSPNVFGTAYAIRAVIAAKKANIELPPGLLEGMTSYLEEQMLKSRTAAEVKAAIAQSLAEVDELSQSSADALYDTMEGQGAFGLASLAIALSHLEGQDDRVKTILDAVESKFDSNGNLVDNSKNDDFYYYGSKTRTKAQALTALGRLRKASTLRPTLTKVLAETTGRYTTQSTAYSLMAVAEQIVDSPPDGAKVDVFLGSEQLTASKELGNGSFEYSIPLDKLRGKDEVLKLRSSSKAAIAFMVDGTWSRDLQDARSMAATSAEKGVNLYRVITDGAGEEIKLDEVEPGQVLRVALLAELPVGKIDRDRMGYLAITDRLPAGFEPMQTDLWTVARAPDLTDAHPFSEWLRWGSTEASYIEMRDDRVYIYFDRLWGRRALATYLVRATTPGTYALPPAVGEFMYVPNSESYSAAGTVKVVK
ncbi:MAG: alpha-2-macroglobulin family protein [Nannocystaceae bacterium]